MKPRTQPRKIPLIISIRLPRSTPVKKLNKQKAAPVSRSGPGRFRGELFFERLRLDFRRGHLVIDRNLVANLRLVAFGGLVHGDLPFLIALLDDNVAGVDFEHRAGDLVILGVRRQQGKTDNGQNCEGEYDFFLGLSVWGRVIPIGRTNFGKAKKPLWR